MIIASLGKKYDIKYLGEAKTFLAMTFIECSCKIGTPRYVVVAGAK